MHDGVGQNLSWLVNALKKRLKAGADPALRDAHRMAQETVREIRNVSHQLHPHILDQLGLKAAIESVAERLRQPSGIRIDVDIDEAVARLSPEQQLHMYRIVQEALGNAIRHSQAQHIGISIRYRPHSLELQIHDDGLGLPEQNDGHGLGLESIRHRVALLSGEVLFQLNEPRGLKILVRLPLDNTV